MGWSIKKPLGGKNSFIRSNISKPGNLLLGGGILGSTIGPAVGAGLTDMKRNFQNKMDEYNRQIAAGDAAAQGQLDELERMAFDEESKRKALGLRQQQQILGFANEQEGRAKEFRGNLAQSLADTGQQFFQRLNPHILEDLNSRGLFTSQTARDQEQTQALADIARENEGSLRAFDTDVFNQIGDIRGTALSSLLGGEQSALDSALELRKAAIQRRFDVQDQARERSFAEMLARRQSRDNLLSSIIGIGGRVGAGFLGAA